MPLAEGLSARRAGPLHQGRLVAGAGRVPQGGDLAHPQDAAFAEQAGARRVERLRIGHGGAHAAHLETGARGVVVVTVGGSHRTEKLPGPWLPGVGGQDGDDLELGVEGDAGDLLLYQDGVLNAASGLLPPPPGPAAHGQPESRNRAQGCGLPYLAVLHPQVALQRGESAQAEDGHGHAVHLEGLGLVGVSGFPRLHAGPLVGLFHVGLRPVGSQGAQHQPRHHALTLVQGRKSAHEGYQGVGAGVEEVIVAEGAQGDVLGAVGPQRDGPRLLALFEAQGVVLVVNLLYPSLGVVGGELGSHHPVVEAAGHEGHAVHVPGQLQGERFGDGDGLEEVLDAEQGALPRPGRRHRQQDRVLPVVVVSKEDFLRVELHRCHSFL